MYEYRCEVVRVIDGDTIEAMVDLGFSTHAKQKLRLAKIDAHELRRGTPKQKELAALAKEYLADMVLAYRPIIVHTIKDRTGKYGRYLAVLYGTDDDGLPVNLNDMMVHGGHAKAS